MSVEIASLQSAVYDILTAPGVDLSTISAKRVRKLLSGGNPSLTDEWVRENKSELDNLIANVFTQLQPPAPEVSDEANEDAQSSEAGPSESSFTPQKRRKEETDDEEMNASPDEEDSEVEETPKKRPAKKSKKAKILTDEEYAKQLSSELNGRTRSSRSGVTGPRKGRGVKGKTGKVRKQLSAATIDTDSEDGGNGAGAGKKRKKRSGSGGGGTARGGFSKEYALRCVVPFSRIRRNLNDPSEPLAAVMEVDKLSRPQVVKKLWEYIKGNDLQNPKNKVSHLLYRNTSGSHPISSERLFATLRCALFSVKTRLTCLK